VGGYIPMVNKLYYVIPLLAVLSLGAQLAHATNESSYKAGYWLGFNNYKCTTLDDPCSGPFASQMSNECAVGPGDVQGWAVTNSTACTDGYIDGFTHWCSQDTKDCAWEIKEGNAPAMTQVAHATNETPSHSQGYNAGQTQANNDWGNVKLHVCPGGEGYCPTSCPPGHSADYCLAYTFGYRDEILAHAEG
jgi:hypothetical protein